MTCSMLVSNYRKILRLLMFLKIREMILLEIFERPEDIK